MAVSACVCGHVQLGVHGYPSFFFLEVFLVQRFVYNYAAIIAIYEADCNSMCMIVSLDEATSA